MSATLELDAVGVRAGRSTLLDEVSLIVKPGTIMAVVGANGAGKTTLLDAICGLVGCEGKVTFDGRPADIEPGRPHPSVARVFQGSPLPATLTVAEVASLAAGNRKGANAMLDRFGLQVHASSFVAELSTGMKRILDLAVATQRDPDVLLLDEPSSGLAASEVEHLADLIKAWRDATGAAVLLVEHDATLVRRVADEVIVLDGGRIVGRGAPADLMDGAPPGIARLTHPADEGVQRALDQVAEVAAPAAARQRRTLSTWSLLRLGLRELAAGMSAVLIFGVLNRVMKVELGISLAVVSALLATVNLAAPFALAVGHRSDTKPIFGRHRSPYIIGGSVLAGLAVVLAPHMARSLAGGLTPFTVLLALALFVLMGVGMYGAGTVFFALLADVTSERERGWAASIVYLELMVGILVGVALTNALLDERATGLTTLFAIVGVLVVALTTIAVWGQEKRAVRAPIDPNEPAVTFRRAVGAAAAMPQTRRFFIFMVVVTIFLFLQQAVLEPFGGDVLGLDVRATSAFNVVQTLGVLAGMIFAGRALTDRFGHHRVAAVGIGGAAAAYAALALAAAFSAQAPSWLAILGIGLGTGLVNVATLALMMDMADKRHTALFMGAWTVAHAIADGLATAGGGTVYAAARALMGGSEPLAYGAVFALEAIGLMACLPLLRRVRPENFATEVETLGPAAPTNAAAVAS